MSSVVIRLLTFPSANFSSRSFLMPVLKDVEDFSLTVAPFRTTKPSVVTNPTADTPPTFKYNFSKLIIMDNDEIKKLIERIIQDLGDDKPISGVLLKAQIVAANLGNENFSTWIKNEQNGYPNSMDIPDYRILNAIVKADISQPLGMVCNCTIPPGMFENEQLNDLLSRARIWQSLFEIENMCKTKPSGNFSINCPVIVYSEVNRYVRGNVQNVRQEFPVSSLASIADIFKSKLLSFFIEIDKKLEAGVDFSSIGKESVNQIMTTYNINSAVANIGDGTINTGDIIGNDITQYVTDHCKQETFMKILSAIKDVVEKSGNAELMEQVNDIQEECKKAHWSKKLLKTTLNALKGIATGVVVDQLSPLIANALALL